MNYLLNASKKHYIIISVLVLGFLYSCSETGTNSNKISLVSAKGYGMIVTKIVTHNDSLISLETEEIDTLRIEPQIPISGTNTSHYLKGLYGIPFNELPNYLTFQYQYAEISDCSFTNKGQVLDIIWVEDYSPRRKGEIEMMSWKKAEYYFRKGVVTLLNDTIVAKGGENRLLLIEKEFANAPYYVSKLSCKNWEPTDSMKFTRTINLKPYNQEIKLYRKNNRSVFGSSIAILDYHFYDNGEIKVYLRNGKTNGFAH